MPEGMLSTSEAMPRATREMLLQLAMAKDNGTPCLSCHAQKMRHISVASTVLAATIALPRIPTPLNDKLELLVPIPVVSGSLLVALLSEDW
jgi:hypothetical protein